MTLCMQSRSLPESKTIMQLSIINLNYGHRPVTVRTVRLATKEDCPIGEAALRPTSLEEFKPNTDAIEHLLDLILDRLVILVANKVAVRYLGADQGDQVSVAKLN